MKRSNVQLQPPENEPQLDRILLNTEKKIDSGSPASRSDQSRRKINGKIKTQVTEIGGPPGPEPTRYGDWEKKGRCIDF